MKIEIYTLNGFRDFVILREKCRINKNKKWKCPDKILETKKFCNIDRNYDRGTIDLYNCLEGKSLEYSLICIITYRMFSSGNLILDIIKSNTDLTSFSKDFLKLKSFSNKAIPYQFVPYVKGVTYKVFFKNNIYKNRKNIIKNLLSLKNASFKEAIDNIHKSMNFEKKLKFGIYQSCLDISYLFPEIIDPNSEPLYGKGSLNSLKEILKKEKNYTSIDEIIEISSKYVDGSLTVLEHGLCEYDKYCKFRLGIKNIESKHTNYKKNKTLNIQ